MERTIVHTTREQAERRTAIALRIAAACAAGEPLRPTGRGTWLDAGRPVATDTLLSTASCNEIVEYVPGDLVITVGAGVTLAELAQVTAEHGQWLALDPPGDAHATIGATVATASSGPLALGSGTIRDLVLGVHSITGAGTSVRAGGRVVKNVAGFDLVRLNTGAFGTLGVITDVSLRLHARPAADVTFIGAHDDADALLAVCSHLGHTALSFRALELLDPALAHAVGAGGGTQWVLLARATGNVASIAALRSAFTALTPVHEGDPALWHALQRADRDGATFRVSARPAQLARTIAQTQQALTAAAVGAVQLRATPHRGTVRVIVPRSHTHTPMQAQVHQHDETWGVALHDALERMQAHVHRVVGERLPARAWRALPAASIDPISRRIRDALDPARILNRGIFGESSS